MTGELMFQLDTDREETIVKVKKLISKGLHDGLLVIPFNIPIFQKLENGEWQRL